MTQPFPDLPRAAQQYAAAGWRVFPLQPRSKRPLPQTHGVKDATAAADMVSAWWEADPSRNIGLATGPITVVDVDLPDGPAALAELELAHGTLPETMEQQTGSGGKQLFFRTTKTIKNSVRTLGPGLDIRGIGGYVVVPPSIHPSGNQYIWTRKVNPAPMPEWLERLLTVRPEPAAAPAIKNPGTSPYGRAALEHEVGRVTAAPEGERNDALNRAAHAVGQLVAGGEIPEDEALSALERAASSCGLPPMEAAATIRSGFMAGTQTPRQAPEKKEKQGSGPPQAAVLIDLAQAQEVQLFEQAGGDIVFADIPVNGHRETWPVRSKAFKRFLAKQFYDLETKPPGNQAVQDAIGVLEAQAQFETEPREIFTRVARVGTSIYMDMCNSKWEAIEITPAGWKVTQNPPVRFRRAAGMLPLPRPIQGGSVQDLRPMMNMGEDQFIMAMAWVLGAASGSGPFPILLLEGEQGTGKSTQSRIIRSILDPSAAPIRTYPREDRDLMVAAQNGWVVAYDNLSGLPVWLSDALCRLSTGGGFSCRQLYTDADETIFQAMRPVILNGIDQIAHRHDLLDRCISCHLDPIPQEKRKQERELWADFERVHPRVLGAICDAVAAGLRREKSMQLDRLPRMADFALWAAAAEDVMPWPNGRFIELYELNREKAVENAVETDTVAAGILALLDMHHSWAGTASELLEELKNHVPEQTQRLKGWPKSAAMLGTRLKRVQTFLRQVGIEVEHFFNSQRRCKSIRLGRGIAVAAVAAVASKENQGVNCNGTVDLAVATPVAAVANGEDCNGCNGTCNGITPPAVAVNSPELLDNNGCNGCNGKKQTLPKGGTYRSTKL